METQKMAFWSAKINHDNWILRYKFNHNFQSYLNNNVLLSCTFARCEGTFFSRIKYHQFIGKGLDRHDMTVLVSERSLEKPWSWLSQFSFESYNKISLWLEVIWWV